MSAVALSAPPAPAPPAPTLPLRTRRILEAPILPTLLKLALPNILVVMVQALSSTVDAVFVARLGPEALAGVSLVHPVWMLMATMSNGGFGGGVVSAVARALGGGRRADANALVSHALWMTLLMGALFTAVPLLAGPSAYRAMGGADDALTTALTYSNVVFGGAILVWLVATLGSVLRGTGEMVYTAGVIVGGELLHLVLAPLLIFGLGPFPALGVAGAGLSLLISYADPRDRPGRLPAGRQGRDHRHVRRPALPGPAVLGDLEGRAARLGQHDPDERQRDGRHEPGGRVRHAGAGRLRRRRPA